MWDFEPCGNSDLDDTRVAWARKYLSPKQFESAEWYSENHLRMIANLVRTRLLPLGSSALPVTGWRFAVKVKCCVLRSFKSSDAQSASLSPMMQQYYNVKKEYKDHLVLFQLGGFLEAFGEDAVTLSSVLGITLTTRGTNFGKPVPMAGVPLHNSEVYISRLVRSGLRVVICEQSGSISGPTTRTESGLIHREVTRVVTRGTVVEESLLHSGHNFLGAIALDSDSGRIGLAWVDVSTGYVR
jgi:hypothetical protein